MICQSCNQKEANVHITKIINGVKNEMHLCEDCAKKKQDLNISTSFNMGLPLTFNSILDGFVEALGGTTKFYPEEKTCPVCNMRFEDFKRSGRLGCGNCYKAFNDNMIPVIKGIHGNIQHNGKVPKRTGGLIKVRRDIDRLKDELKRLVNNEEYEKAARIRDEIKELEGKLNQGEGKGE